MNGKAIIVTISEAIVETFYVPQINDRKTAVVLSFEGKHKRLILNKNQCLSMVKITDSEIFSDWTGQTTVLVPGNALNGKPTIAILPVREKGVGK